MIDLKQHPRVTVKESGLRVANFSSMHPFTFADGTVLPAVEESVSKSLDLEQIEIAQPRKLPGVNDVKMVFVLTPAVELRLTALDNDPDVDVVLVPFPVLQALAEAGVPFGKARVIRTVDRKSRAICTDKFCVL